MSNIKRKICDLNDKEYIQYLEQIEPEDPPVEKCDSCHRYGIGNSLKYCCTLASDIVDE